MSFNEAYAYNNRGFAYLKQREYDRAIQAFTEALRLNPHDTLAYVSYLSRGLAYRLKGEHDRAVRDLDQALRLDPHDADTYLGRGLAYARQGEYARARSDYNQALALGFDRATVEVALARLPAAHS